MEKKLTLWMGEEADNYKEKIKIIGQRLLDAGVDVKDYRNGGISSSAVVRYLIDEEIKHLEIVQGE